MRRMKEGKKSIQLRAVGRGGYKDHDAGGAALQFFGPC